MPAIITEESSTALTEGIRVTVQPAYVPERSDPAAGTFFFAYHIEIKNEGTAPARLLTRHWVITDGAGHIEEVRGDGVVGDQPHLVPGEAHEYTSFCPIRTPRGSMHGSYGMVRDDGAAFDAEVPPFALVAPGAEQASSLN